MSSTDLDLAPGLMLMALNPMRAWETEDVRGAAGDVIQHGETGLLLRSWIVGNKLRLKLLRDHRILIFSCQLHAAHRNWQIVPT